MKFVPAKSVNLWDPRIQDRIISGECRPARGQWMYCGLDNDKPCRYVGCSPGGVLWVAHWQGSPAATTKHFLTCCKAFKE